MEDRILDEQMRIRVKPVAGRLGDNAVDPVSTGAEPPSVSCDFGDSKNATNDSSDLWHSDFSDDQEDWTVARPDPLEAQVDKITGLRSIRDIYDPELKISRAWDIYDDNQIIVGLWPHGNTNPELGERAKSRKTDIEKIVTVFSIGWVGLLFYFILHGTGMNFLLNLQSLIPLMLIPLFAMLRGNTHVRFWKDGFEFATINAASSKVRKTVKWSQIDKVYLDGKTTPTILDQSLCLEEKNGIVHSIKLRKIANRGQWDKVLLALDKWCSIDTTELDRKVFGTATEDRTSPTYTMLWLEALAAPPRRERLTPMTEGTLLCKGRYVLKRKLGAGGQGSAFLAVSTDDASNVVLKEYILPTYVDIKTRKQALERFEHEAKMLSGLNHPSIVQLLDYFVDDHRAYLVLEYIDGDNLQQVVEKNGPMPDALALNCANALVDILVYLHNQTPPVVHRDFTPDNLVTSSNGTIKLIDFMVAQQTDSSQQQSASSTVVGKHAYMAPEQFRGQNRTQSDIYALGCTLYYLLTGKEPEPITQLHPILDNENCPLILNEIVSKCTESDYLDRYQSVEEIKTQLARASRSDL